MASNNREAGPSSSSNSVHTDEHQSLEDFLAKFAAQSKSQISECALQNEASSVLKPTAAEFFPRHSGHQTNLERNSSSFESHVRQNDPRCNNSRRQYNGHEWNNGRKNARYNNHHVGHNFSKEHNGHHAKFHNENNYANNQDKANSSQQYNHQQQNVKWKGSFGGGRYRPTQIQKYQHQTIPQDDTRENVVRDQETRERRFGGYHRNKVRQEKYEAKIISKCSQRDKLIRELDSSKLECLVCCETVRPNHSIWSCPNCYHILHLHCTIKWASSSKSENGWRCPACQNISKRIPRDYFCFCGKQKNPQYNRSDVAHSCGELCGREESCSHSCTLLCHPGPCPPCQAIVQRSCGCGKTTKPLQCNQRDDIVCDATCGRQLNCELHNCEKKCHMENCGDCEQGIEHQCYCGVEKKQVPCTIDNLKNKRFSCGKICNAQLACENHNCTMICHEEPCGNCLLSPEVITSCPCGKQPVVKGERKSCLDSIPVCKGFCGKLLPCGTPGSHHVCSSRCHLGDCPPCNKSTIVKCRCGHMDQQIKCKQLQTRADDARCKKRCTKMRSCAKHKCKQECCIDYDHICPKTCSQMLSCGRHRCDKPCHKGSCSTCHRVSFDELTCECGASVIFPPVPCGTKKPRCDKPCSRQHPCSHDVLHNCHPDPTCPPCVVLTTQYCYGKHEQRKTIPCYQDSFSCGLPCAKPLPCGRHKCIKSCHERECFVEGEICKQSCTTIRTNCPHQCKVPCHDGDCPPDVPCREIVEVTCECGNRKQMRTCHDFSKEYRRITSAQLASSMQEMQRGGSVELSDILGPMKPKNNKTLECNEECRLLERNRRLAIGLQIRNPDLSSKLQPNYSEFLKTYAKKDPNLIKMIHEKLTELVKLAKQSKQKSRSYSFPVMNREKRRVVYEMCNMFGIEAVAYDAEPNRNMVATADRFKSWLPSMSLLEVIQRENGQRRVVVPNLNAWGRTTNNVK